MVVDQHRPLGARQLGHGRGDRSVRADSPPRAVAAEHIRSRVAGVGEHGQRPRVRQLTPPHFARPRAAVGALGEPPALEHANHAVARAGLLERPKQISDRGLDLFVGVDGRLTLLVTDDPTGSGNRSSPRSAAGRLAPCRREVIMCSSASDISTSAPEAAGH
jgi:hypothetical protein